MTRSLFHSAVSGLLGNVRFAAGTVAVLAIAVWTTSASAALVHHWAFDESDGLGPPQVLNSVSSNHGTFSFMDDSNRSTDRAPSTFSGRSLQYNGVDEKVTLASQIGLYSNTTNFSVAFWYKGTEPADNSTAWGAGIIGRNSTDIYANIILRGGKVEFLHHNSGWQHNIRSTTTVTNDQWHHVAVVNRSTGRADLYVDGVMEISDLPSTTDGGAVLGPFRIDGFMSGFTSPNSPLDVGFPLNFTQGLLDEVRIYNHALDANEVFLLAQIPVPEPSSALLLLGGLVLGRRHLKRNRRG